MKKILISSLVALILTFNLFFSYQRAYAFGPWILAVPAAAEATYVGAMTAVMTGAAVGTAGMEWLNSNYDDIQQTARTTWGLMSADMKDNFAQSLSQVGDGVVLGSDMINAYLENFKNSAANIIETLKPTPTFDGTFYTFPSGTYLSMNGVRWADAFRITIVNDYYTLAIAVQKPGSAFLAGDNLIGQYTYDQLEALLSDSPVANIDVYNRFAPAVSRLSVDGTMPQESMYDRVGNWLARNDRYTSDAGIVIPQAVPYTATGQRLMVNDMTGDLALLDGTPYTGDVSWRSPAVGVVDGKVVAQNPAGLTDVLTGDLVVPKDRVIPGDIPGTIVIDGAPAIPFPNIDTTVWDIPATTPVVPAPAVPGEFAGPTKPIAWDKLKMNAQALTTKFPFSIPWDLMRQLKVFNVAPETPVFEIDIGDYLKIGEYTIPMNFEVDLGMFDKVAAFIRWFNLILWDIGLVLLIRKLLPE